MKRITAYLLKTAFHLSAGLSFLLFVVVILGWARSYVANDLVLYQPKIDWVLHSYTAGWGKGYIGGGMQGALPGSKARLQRKVLPPARLDGTGMPNEIFYFAGVRVTCTHTTQMINVPIREVHVFMPCWLPAALSACLPALWCKRRYRQQLLRRRLAAGQCLSCGYDLRSTPDRCPECGTAATAGK